MKNKNYRIYFLLFLIIPAFACQLLDSLAPSETEPNVKILPTLTPVGGADADETAEPSDTEPELDNDDTTETTEPGAPAPTPTRDENAPPALPQIIPTDEPTALPPAPDVELSTYKSPAGYEFDHPTKWVAADLFGQTILSNDPAVLDSGQLANGQTLVLLIAGTLETNGTTAETIMQEVQQDILAEYLSSGVLTPISNLEPIDQAGANGVQLTQQLSTSTDTTFFLQTTSLIHRNLYVVSISMMNEADRALFETINSAVQRSITVTSDRFLANPATYGLRQGELQALNRELDRSAQLPDFAQPIELGEIEGEIGADGVMVYQFTADAETALALTVSPTTPNFDPTVDVVDNKGVSILPSGGSIDNGSAGEQESIEALTIPTTGDYRIVIRGFGYSSGEFTVQLGE